MNAAAEGGGGGTALPELKDPAQILLWTDMAVGEMERLWDAHADIARRLEVSERERRQDAKSVAEAVAEVKIKLYMISAGIGLAASAIGSLIVGWALKQVH